MEGRGVLLLGRTAGSSQMAGNVMGNGEPERQSWQDMKRSGIKTSLYEQLWRG